MESINIEQELDAAIAGDAAAGDRVILHYLPQVKSYASKFAFGKKPSHDDFVATACFGLCDAVRRLLPEWDRHDNPLGYILTTCRRYMSELIQDDHTVRIPATSFRAMIRSVLEEDAEDGVITRSETIREIIPLAVSNTQHHHYGDDDAADFAPPSLVPVVVDDEPYIVPDLLECLNFTSRETFVAVMLTDGYTITEIGEMIGVTKQAIGKVKNQIKEKLECYYRRDDVPRRFR